MSESIAIMSVNELHPDLRTYQRQFTDYLRNPINHEVFPKTLPAEIKVYARLLYNKIESSLRVCFPIARELLGPVHWRQIVQAFIRDHRCQSPLYREIPDEFIDYLLHGNPQVKMPGFITELAHYEWMELILETAHAGISAPIITDPMNPLEHVPILNPVLHILHYRYPVHCIVPSDERWKSWETRLEPYDQEPMILVGLRDNDLNIQFIEINAVTARLIELLRDQFRTGEQALRQLATEMGYCAPEPLLSHGREIIQQLQTQQIIIGGLDV
ncbi:MAG: HvfC family RiPP maturation protein [Gammaproteobacteria bacterium]